MFPEYSQNDFYVGGQSYAGKYVPALGYYIHQQNHGQHPPEVPINFKGIYVGAGFCNPEKMMPEFADYLFSVGFISDYKRRELRERLVRVIKDGLSGKNLLSPSDYLSIFFSTPAYIPTLDHLVGAEATLTSKLPLLPMWMGDGSTRVALHVGLITQSLQRQWLHTAWEPEKFFGVAAMDALRHEFLQDTVRENAFLMDNYKVLHYSGNLDMIVNVPMTEAFLSSVPWSGQAEYKSSDLSPWRFGSDSAVGSFIKIKNFTRVIIWNSGHMVPYDQPEWALRMMERFIFDKPFVTNDVTPSYFTSDADDDSDEDLL